MRRWAESWAASTAIRAPWACARPAKRATGQTSPVTLEAAVMTTRRWREGCSDSASSSRAYASSSVRGTGSRTVRNRPQGSSVEWCSLPKTKTVVRLGSALLSTAHESVVVRVKTTESPSLAPTNSATSARACSYHALVSRDAKPAPRWTEEYVSSARSTAALTVSSAGVEAAWSRLAYAVSPRSVGTRSSAPTTVGSDRASGTTCSARVRTAGAGEPPHGDAAGEVEVRTGEGRVWVEGRTDMS